MRTIDLDKAQQVVADGMNQTASERLKLQQERLHELVAYARKYSPYFAKLYASIPESFNLTDLPIRVLGNKYQLTDNQRLSCAVFNKTYIKAYM